VKKAAPLFAEGQRISGALVLADPDNPARLAADLDGRVEASRLLPEGKEKAQALREQIAAAGVLMRIYDARLKKDAANAAWEARASGLGLLVGRNTLALVKSKEEPAKKLADLAKDLGAVVGVKQRLADLDPENARWASELARAHLLLSAVEGEAGHKAARVENARKAHAALTAFAKRRAKEGGSSHWQRALVLAQFQLGDSLVEAEQGNAAKVELEKALKLAQKVPGGAKDRGWQREVARMHFALGKAHLAIASDLTREDDPEKEDARKQAFAGYLAQMRSALALRKKLAAGKPADRSLRGEVLDTYKEVASALRLSGERRQAEQLEAEVFADRCRHVRKRLADLVGKGKSTLEGSAESEAPEEAVRRHAREVAANSAQQFELHGGPARAMELLECYLDCLEEADRWEKDPVGAVRKRLGQMVGVYEKLRDTGDGKLKPAEEETERAMKGLLDKLGKDSSKKDD
jgi:hypothetical protein